ncbi:DUF6053 domain-containing protein [Lysobacter sp. TAB13]
MGGPSGPMLFDQIAAI